MRKGGVLMLIAKEHPHRAGGVMTEADCAADNERRRKKQQRDSFAEFMRAQLDKMRNESRNEPSDGNSRDNACF